MGMTADQTRVDNLVRDLVRLLTDQIDLHNELAMHMRHKLDAIKRADSDQIQSITAREMVLVSRAQEREGLRKQITQKIVEGLGVRRTDAKKMRMSELAELLAEPRRSQ